MYHTVPKEWIEINTKKFEEILKTLNYKKDDFGFHCLVSNKKRFAIVRQDGIFIDPRISK